MLCYLSGIAPRARRVGVTFSSPLSLADLLLPDVVLACCTRHLGVATDGMMMYVFSTTCIYRSSLDDDQGLTSSAAPSHTCRVSATEGVSAVRIIFFCFIKYTHIRRCPRHYGSSLGHRRVVASSTPLIPVRCSHHCWIS